MNLSILIPMGVGLIIGCCVFLLIIKLLLKHFYMETYYSIVGFTLGSILVLYSPLSFNFTGLSAIILLIIGFKVARKLEKV